jgi:hypothetical protein
MYKSSCACLFCSQVYIESMHLALVCILAVQLFAERALGFSVQVVQGIEHYRSVSGKRVVFFHSSACRACAVALPRFEALSQTSLAEQYTFLKMNIDGDLNLLREAQKLGITTIPRVAILAAEDQYCLMPCSNAEAFFDLKQALEKE